MAGWMCNRCNEAIVTCDCLRSNDRMYHVKCFTCAICDTPIDAAACQIKTNLQEVYCRDCHRRYFQDVSRHSLLGGRLDDEDSLSQVGDGVKVVPAEESIKSISEPNSESDHRENADGLAIKAMLHKYSTPVHSIHEIMPPPLLSSVKRPLKTKGERKPPPVTPKGLMSNPTIEEEAPDNLDSPACEPKNDATQETPLAPIPKKKVVRARSRIPVLTPVSSRTQVEEKTPAKTPIVVTPRRTKPDAPRNTSTPIVTAMSSSTSSAVNDYIKNKAKRGFERSTPRPPSRKATPMKATHSLPKTCQPRFIKPEFPKSMSSMSADTSFSRQSSTGSFVSTPRRTDSQASACTTFVVPRNTPQRARPSSSISDRPSASGSYSNNIPSHSQLQLMSWNNLHVSPAELPSTQQLLSLMLHPGEKNRPHSEDMSRASSALSSRSRGGCLDCPICYEGLIDDSVPGEISKGPAKKLLENVVTECGHIFHRECITNWLVTNGNSKCPICQKLCVTESLIPVYLDANATIDSKSNDNGLSSLVTTLRFDYKDLVDKYNCLLQEHQECGVKCAISDSLKSAYEVECRNRVELQWENKRLQRKIEDLQAKVKVAQGDTPQPQHS